MFKCYVSLMTILALQHEPTQITAAVATIEKRIESLKREIMQDIQEDQLKIEIAPEGVANDYGGYENYIDTKADDLITPIVKYIHKQHKHRHRLGYGTNLTGITPRFGKSNNKTTKTVLSLARKVTYRHKVTPADVFYRRFYLDEEERNKPQKWTHCLDSITPRLEGYTEGWKPAQVNSDDPDVRRLAYLLNINTTLYTKEEIITILYQISNIRIRIFQWDYTALKSILNIIIPGDTHDFRSLKAGVKEMFKKWHLDTNLTETFLKQTRVFRPPCIEISEYGAFHQSHASIRINKDAVGISLRDAVEIIKILSKYDLIDKQIGRGVFDSEEWDYDYREAFDIPESVLPVITKKRKRRRQKIKYRNTLNNNNNNIDNCSD